MVCWRAELHVALVVPCEARPCADIVMHAWPFRSPTGRGVITLQSSQQLLPYHVYWYYEQRAQQLPRKANDFLLPWPCMHCLRSTLQEKTTAGILHITAR